MNQIRKYVFRLGFALICEDCGLLTNISEFERGSITPNPMKGEFAWAKGKPIDYEILQEPHHKCKHCGSESVDMISAVKNMADYWIDYPHNKSLKPTSGGVA